MHIKYIMITNLFLIDFFLLGDRTPESNNLFGLIIGCVLGGLALITLLLLLIVCIVLVIVMGGRRRQKPDDKQTPSSSEGAYS